MKYAVSRVTRGGCHGLWQTAYFLNGSAFVRTPVMLPYNGSIGFRTHLSGRAPAPGRNVERGP